MKLLSRFGLFLGRTGTSYHRCFLKEHTSNLFLLISSHSKTQMTQSLSHTETEQFCQLRGLLFPAVKLAAISNPSCLVLHEVSSQLPACSLFMLHVTVFFNHQLLSLFGLYFDFGCLAAGCHSTFSPCATQATVSKSINSLQ